MTKQENIAKINLLIANFVNTKDETKLKKIVQEIIEVSSSFKYEAKWRDEVMKIIIPGLCNILLENISAIADGTIEPLTDQDVAEALTELKDITGRPKIHNIIFCSLASCFCPPGRSCP